MLESCTEVMFPEIEHGKKSLQLGLSSDVDVWDGNKGNMDVSFRMWETASTPHG